jgi:hypothetical protein
MAFQLKSGHKLVDFFKNAGKKIKAAGVKHQTWRDSRAKASADANAAGGGFKKFQADAAEMRKKGKSIFELQKIDAAAKARKNAKKKEKESGDPVDLTKKTGLGPRV